MKWLLTFEMFGYHLAPEINHQFEVGSYRLDNDLMHQQFALVYVLPTRMNQHQLPGFGRNGMKWPLLHEEKRIQDEIQELNPLIANSGGTLRMSELPFVLLQFLQATT
ncbi:hypothetical protein C5167_029084 [Papaver somniferum]|nr:hypothetical protein C5167_029084 [Papaver somniferum]